MADKNVLSQEELDALWKIFKDERIQEPEAKTIDKKTKHKRNKKSPSNKDKKNA